MASSNGSPLVVAALPSELRHMLDVVEIRSERRIGPWVHWSANLDNRELDILLCGIGMVNAGAALARALHEFTPPAIVNFGCAGAHRQDINPGDVIVGTRYVHHRASTILPDGVEQHALTPIVPEDTSIFVDGFDADAELLAIAQRAAADWRPDPWNVSGDSDIIGETHIGPVASADSWAQSTVHIARIHEQHGTLCEDMEAAALAQIAHMHRIPFLAIKDISNNEFQTQTEHGAVGGPTLESVRHEIGKRAFALVRRTFEFWEP